jgi:hypothetical protein
MDSPRMAWRKRHLIYTHRDKREVIPWAAWFANEGKVGNKPPENPDRVGYGKTEWDAIIDLAKMTRTKLWNEE